MNRTMRLFATTALLGGPIACSDDPTGPGEPDRPQQSPVLVSAPASGSGTMPAVSSTLMTVYVSMPPGTDPEGTLVTVRNGGDGPSVTAPIIDGGFDPVAILAAAGDSLVILVSAPDGVAESYARVPVRSRPVVVRTAPRHRRTDVPLNSVVRVVFNEPMDSASVVDAVRVRRGGTDVPGTVTGISVNGDILAATFEPAAPLDAETGYTLVVSAAARSRQGAPLEAPTEAEFTTGDGVTTGATLTVTAATTGSDLDQDGYTVTIAGAGDREGTLGANGSFTAEGMAPGVYYAGLAGISQNCTPAASNVPGEPGFVRQVTIDAGQAAEVSFELTCRPVGTGSLVVTTSTTGADPDPDGYRFTVNDGPEQTIGANGTVTIPDLSDTTGYTVELRGMNGNCRHIQPDTFWWWGTVATDGVTTAAFTIECDAATFAATGTIAFSSEILTGDAVTGSAIWISNADGTGRVQLTDGDAYDAEPAWSPDGQRLAFTRFDDGALEIYVMNADGSNQTRRTFSGWNTAPAWSPDGSLIAFGRAGHVYVMHADDTDRGYLARVGTHEFWSDSPTWSPDGSRIAFIGRDAGSSRYDLYIMDADGGNLRKVDLGASVAGEIHSPAWSPGGSTIAVVAEDAAAWVAAVTLVNADGSGARVVGDGWEPAWSPDGAGLAFSARNCQPCVRYVGVDGGVSSGIIENGSAPAWRP